LNLFHLRSPVSEYKKSFPAVKQKSLFAIILARKSIKKQQPAESIKEKALST